MAALPHGTETLADGEAVASRAAERIVEVFAARPPDARLALCLSGGSTPKRLYGLLAAPPLRDRVPWARLHLFLGDERHVPADDPASNWGMVRGALLAIAPVPPENRHPIPTAGTLEADATAYEAELRAFARSGVDPDEALFDVVLLGLGEDGHTASLFPGKPAVEEEARWVVGAPVAGLPPLVPRITLTRPALARSRLTLFLAAGEGKRGPLARVAAGEPLPSTRTAAGAGGEVAWLVDRAAAGA